MNDDDLDEVKKSFALVMKMLAEQRLDLETYRVLFRANGVTDEDVQLVRTELKQRWDKEADALVERIKNQRSAVEMRRLLESVSDTKH